MPALDARAGDRRAVAATAELLGAKWTALIVHDLSEGPRGFCEIQRACGVGPRTLGQRLDTLAKGGYVVRAPGGARPRYGLTERGKALLPILDAMRAFGHAWLVRDAGHRAACPAPHGHCAGTARVHPGRHRRPPSGRHAPAGARSDPPW